jgi:hypothetical protein
MHLVLFLVAFLIKLGLSAKSSTKDSKENSIDPKLLEIKINLHEQILNAKYKNFSLSNQIKEKRQIIDSIIDSQLNSKSNKNFSSNTLPKDEAIEKIKKDKLEKENNILFEEVKLLKEEVRNKIY